MTANCNCQNCNGEFEFDTADFQESNRIGNMVFGQTIQCPHCNQETSVYKIDDDAPQKLQPFKKEFTPEPIPQYQPRHESPMLAPCGACGKPVSRTAQVCPHCGHTGTPAGFETIIVRIIISLVIFFVIYFILSLFDD
jgi:hypothetical protein